MNILVINHYAGSPRYGMEYRPYFLAREWVKAGHQVTIAAAAYSHLRQDQPVVTGSFTVENIDGINYMWLPSCAYKSNGIKRAFNIFEFVLRLLLLKKHISRTFRPHVVIASSTYPLDIVPARQIAILNRAELVYEVHDLWPLSPIELGGMSANNPFIMLMQWAEDYAYRHVDKVISMLPKAEGHMRSRGLSEGKFYYVPNGVDKNDWEQANTSGLNEDLDRCIRDLREKGFFLVGYAGAHGTANALSSLIEAANILKEKQVAFILVGQGQEKENLIKMAERLGSANVYFFSPIPRTMIPAFLGTVDVLYIGLQRTPIYRFGISPNKLMDYMMAGQPIIQAIEVSNDMVSDVKCGITVPPEDPKAIADAIIEIKSMTEVARVDMGQLGKKYILEEHNYHDLAKRFLSYL